MLEACDWRTVSGAGTCSFQGCDNEARYRCLSHPKEGPVCRDHRRVHRKGLLREKRGDMDSRPRSGLSTDRSDEDAAGVNVGLDSIPNLGMPMSYRPWSPGGAVPNFSTSSGSA